MTIRLDVVDDLPPIGPSGSSVSVIVQYVHGLFICNFKHDDRLGRILQFIEHMTMIGWVDRGESSDRARLGRPVIDGIASATFLDTLHGFFVAGTSAHFIAIANVREHQIDPE